MTNKYTVGYAITALEQLDEIETFIIGEGEANRAFSFTARIRAACESLNTFPSRYRKRDDIRDGLRVFGFENRVTITYEIDEQDFRVTILGIHYGGRNWESQYLQDGI